jgi:hypothetical protein
MGAQRKLAALTGTTAVALRNGHCGKGARSEASFGSAGGLSVLINRGAQIRAIW